LLNRNANGDANWLEQCLKNAGGISSGPPLALPIIRLITLLTSVGVKII